MKKILEVLQDGEKLVFETDVKPTEEEFFEVASRSLDEESLAMAKSFSEAQRELEKAGGKVMTFYPERHSSKLPN